MGMKGLFKKNVRYKQVFVAGSVRGQQAQVAFSKVFYFFDI